MQDVVCHFCGGRHSVYELHADQTCCRRTIDAVHTCGRPTRPPSARTFCTSCQEMVERTLGELPELYIQLYLGLEKGSSGWGERRSSGFESRVPLTERASELMAEMVGSSGGAWVSPKGQEWRARSDPRGILPGLEDELRDHLGFARRRVVAHANPDRAGQAGPTLYSTTRFLTVHLAALLEMRPDTGNELIRLRQRIQRFLRTDRRSETEDLREASCPWCGQRSLYRTYGDDRVRCGSGQRCREITLAEYRLLSLKELGWAAGSA